MQIGHFFIRGQSYGSREIRPMIRWGAPHLHPSYCFICPKCGEIWAQIFIEGQDYAPIVRRCLEHGSGSLNKIFPPDFHRNFPREVLLRELQIVHHHQIADERTYMNIL